ncbi:MAG: DUF805 domain-containing protein [Azovibrio sp.]
MTHGRIGQGRYVGYCFMPLLIPLTAFLLLYLLPSSGIILLLIMAVPAVPLLLIFLFCSAARRLHDIGHASDVALFIFAPGVNLLLFLYLMMKGADPYDNEYGPGDKGPRPQAADGT